MKCAGPWQRTTGNQGWAQQAVQLGALVTVICPSVGGCERGVVDRWVFHSERPNLTRTIVTIPQFGGSCSGLSLLLIEPSAPLSLDHEISPPLIGNVLFLIDQLYAPLFQAKTVLTSQGSIPSGPRLVSKGQYSDSLAGITAGCKVMLDVTTCAL